MDREIIGRTLELNDVMPTEYSGEVLINYQPRTLLDDNAIYFEGFLREGYLLVDFDTVEIVPELDVKRTDVGWMPSNALYGRVAVLFHKIKLYSKNQISASAKCIVA
jgi:hypothetical protein